MGGALIKWKKFQMKSLIRKILKKWFQTFYDERIQDSS